jgi:hypothetical protein
MQSRAAAGLMVGVLGAVLAVSGLSVQGCGGGGGAAACTVGSVGCPCTGGGVCDPGLTCASNRCVNLNTVDGGGGGAGSGGGGSGGAVTAEAMCDSFTAYCRKLNECASALVKIGYSTVEECSKRFALSCKDAVKASGSGLTAATITACGAALPGATCEDVIYRKVTACNIKGTVGNGMACGTNEQCATGYCAQSDQACGVCSASVGAGSTCMVTDDCEPGLVCSDDAHCVVPAAAGSICNDNQPCKYGLYCRNGSCANGASAPGATCEPLLASSCNVLKGIFCDANTAKCANLGFAVNGDPCGNVASKFVFCAKGECVFPDATATEGVCGALADDGATCDATTFCETPARCIGGKCKLTSSAACL